MPISTKTPNILWICTDQQRFDTIHVLGNAHIRTLTPGSTRRRRRYLTARAYSQSPVCILGRASFLTGHYPNTILGGLFP